MARIFVDPSIRNCAQALLMEALEDVNRRVSCGDSFWAARTRVLEMHANEWVRLYGKDAADQAVRGLHMLAPAEVLDRETRRTVRNREVAECRAHLAARDPKRNTWINRAWLSLFGMRLY
ncbi:hypothetical protein [Methylorubrum aminovorans]